MDSLIYVDFKKTLLTADVEKQLQTVIEERIKSLPSYLEHRLNPELILLACNLIENGCKDNKKLKLNKKALCLKVLQSIFTYNPVEIKQFETILEFLHLNDKIKLVGLKKKVLIIAKDWIKRKFL